MTNRLVHSKVNLIGKFNIVTCAAKCKDFSYSELVEIHRIDEATATPVWEGASLSEIIRTIRGLNIERLKSAYFVSGLFFARISRAMLSDV